MEAFLCETESWVSSINENPDEQTNQLLRTSSSSSGFTQETDEEEWPKLNRLKSKKKKKKKKQVLLEGYVEAADDDDLSRTKSLTDEDLDELKGCLDLGFGFSYEEIPELCNTLPALELCYSMSQKFMDEHQKSPENSPASVDTVSSQIANWKISSPGMDVPAVLEAVDDGCILRKRKMKNLSAVRVSIRASPSTCSPLPLLRLPFRLELQAQLEGERMCLCPD